MTESAQPNRDQELEQIVDELTENVMGEREQEPREGSAEEPTA